jgi:Holliday junction resolvasome RuvABC endonuclease subunit
MALVDELPKRWVLAFDIGSHNAACCLVDDQETIKWKREWKSKQTDPLPRRLFSLYDWMDVAIDDMVHSNRISQRAVRPIITVAAEEPYVRRVRASLVLGQVLGLLYAALWENCFPILERRLILVKASSAKKALTGRGNATKKQMVNRAEKVTGLKNMSEHLADAFAVGVYTIQQMHQGAATEMADEPS